MSFRINTNVNALNAMRNLSATNSQISQSITRLSTGLRINSAADDPSGLIASEKFNAQIGGLTQAISNSQDAINYAKTAEGGLSNMNTLLDTARTLAVASSNSATLSSSQLQANQQQLASIVSSITSIAQTTQYGSKNLLDGSSGNQSAVTDASLVSALHIGGTFGGKALTANGTVTLGAVTAATQGQIVSAAFATTATAVTNAGSFTLNGTTFSATTSTTAADLINEINKAQNQTGVVASYDGGATAINLTSVAYGSKGVVNLVDANGVIASGGAGASTSAGTDAHVSVTIGTTSATFTGSLQGNDGLTLQDADGNTLSLTAAGNANGAAAAVGQVQVGSSQFQIGANAGQTATLSLGNYAASSLGTGAVNGLTLNNLDLTTASGASNAITVIDKAISDVTSARGMIGNFQANVLQPNINSMGVAKENLSSSLSAIRDTDVASEMTNYTKLQILQQAGMSVLSQANSQPQQVLTLLRGG